MTDPVKKPEVWLRGPVDGVPALLQPVAHALLQAEEEVTALVRDFPDDRLWIKPHGLASAGFHLQHLAGVLDRLTTYARGKPLSPTQLSRLKAEGSAEDSSASAASLAFAFSACVADTIDLLRATPEGALLEPRSVGRSGLPSTVLGLLVHCAEHTMRHVGQLLVTTRVVRESSG